MSEFGDPAGLDIDKLIRMSEEYEARAEEMQERMSTVAGHAESEKGMVKVTCTVEGISELEIAPRAMRMPAAELAETIKSLIRAATQDFQSRSEELTTEMFGEENSPVGLRRKAEAADANVQNAAAAYERAVNDTMGELDRIRKRLGL